MSARTADRARRRWGSDDVWAQIAAKTDEHPYMGAIARTAERVAASAEVFTPTELVVEMLRTQSPELFAPGKTVLDPACGDGQFLAAVKWVKVLIWGMSEQAACADIYGVDIMVDNVELCRWRLGGGTILCGDTLNPTSRPDGQSDTDHRKMMELFGPKSAQPSLFDVA